MQKIAQSYWNVSKGMHVIMFDYIREYYKNTNRPLWLYFTILEENPLLMSQLIHSYYDNSRHFEKCVFSRGSSYSWRRVLQPLRHWKTIYIMAAWCAHTRKTVHARHLIHAKQFGQKEIKSSFASSSHNRSEFQEETS